MNQVQEKILEIFKEVKAVCERNNITYYAIGGTCIGAVRHKGFIPWDDDLDIAIPIQDYKRFLKVARDELPDQLHLYTCDDIVHYRYIFAKVHDIRTTFIEQSEAGFSDAFKGIYLDIMPLGAVPDDSIERHRFGREMLRYYRMNYYLRFPYCSMKKPKNKIPWLGMRLIKPFVGINTFSNKWLELLENHPLGSTGMTGYTWWTLSEKLVFPYSDFEGTVELPFEDTTISCPKDYHDYLTRQFGNYMELPPESERLTHNPWALDFGQSYKKLQDKYSTND